MEHPALVGQHDAGCSKASLSASPLPLLRSNLYCLVANGYYVMNTSSSQPLRSCPTLLFHDNPMPYKLSATLLSHSADVRCHLSYAIWESPNNP